MKPRSGKVIVRANLNQKEEITYGTLTLVIPFRSQLIDDGKVGNPTLCEVVASNEDKLKEGDVLVLAHNSLENKAWWIEKDGNEVTLSIPVDRWILGKLGDNGELIPLHGNTICKRISEPERSSIIITPDAYKKTELNKAIVLSVAPEIKDLHEGSTAVFHVYSDYEIHYNVNNEDRSAVVIYDEDIVAVS